MKYLPFALILCASSAFAWSTKENPDQYPSIGLDISSGKIAGVVKDNALGLPQTDGGFVKGLLDIRVPMTNTVTVHAFGSSTGINNNKQYSEGSEVGLGLRIYLK